MRNLVATLALVWLSVGFGLIHVGLGLIVPSAIIFGCLAYTRLREEADAGRGEKGEG